MRLRTATGLALASLCAVAAVMVSQGPPIGGTTETGVLAILVIDNGVLAHSDLTSWDCPRVTAGPDLS